MTQTESMRQYRHVQCIALNRTSPQECFSKLLAAQPTNERRARLCSNLWCKIACFPLSLAMKRRFHSVNPSRKIVQCSSHFCRVFKCVHRSRVHNYVSFSTLADILAPNSLMLVSIATHQHCIWTLSSFFSCRNNSLNGRYLYRLSTI